MNRRRPISFHGGDGGEFAPPQKRRGIQSHCGRHWKEEEEEEDIERSDPAGDKEDTEAASPFVEGAPEKKHGTFLIRFRYLQIKPKL